jgi:hypothetical protein
MAIKFDPWKRRRWSRDVLPAGDPAKKSEPLE